MIFVIECYSIVNETIDLYSNVRPGKVASEVASISLYEEDSDFQPPSEASDGISAYKHKFIGGCIYYRGKHYVCRKYFR